jgi:hypothetical protein
MTTRDIEAVDPARNIEESLKSARSVYLVLMGVCAAIALFAASPRDVERYSKASRELRTIRALDFADFVRYEQGLIATNAARISWLQPAVLFPKGRIVASLSPLDLFPAVFAGDPKDGKINQVLDFFDTKHPVKVFMPNEQDSVFKNFLQNLASAAIASPSPELQSLSFRNGVDTISPTSLPAYAVYSPTGSGAAPVLDATVFAHEVIISEDAFHPWVNSAQSPRDVNNMRSTSGTLFENLRAVENEIVGMTLDEASRYLAGRISFMSRKINVLGTTIDEPLAIVGGPLAVLLLLVYLLLLCWQLAELSNSTLAAAQNYPWVVLMPGWQGKAVRATAVSLPVGVCLWLFATSAKSASVQELVISLAVILLIGLAGASTWRQLSKMRRKIGR